MLEAVNQVDEGQAGIPEFLTLTFPDRFPEEWPKYKAMMEAFREAVRRRFPEAWGLWRLEFKRRRTGENAGRFAPHFHLLLWGLYRGRYVDGDIPPADRVWLARTWFRIVDSGDVRHYRVTRNRKSWVVLDSRRAVRLYISKYCGKVGDEDERQGPEGTGRIWGRINCGGWLVRLVRFAAGLRGEVTLRRILRRYLRRATGKRWAGRGAHSTLTAFMSWGSGLCLMAWISAESSGSWPSDEAEEFLEERRSSFLEVAVRGAPWSIGWVY